MQSLYLLHMDPSVFPDPFAFQPQRWLANPDLKRNLFAFSRGSRGCLGMKYVYSLFILQAYSILAYNKQRNGKLHADIVYECSLAMSELYFAIAMLWRSMDFEIVDTVEERDVWTTNDCFIGMTDLKSRGVKVRVLGEVGE
jgi:hypothetical protein